jgi:hypothetical protein
MFSLPEEYLEFKNLFKLWGVEDYPTEDFCKSVLKLLKTKNEGKKLSPTKVELVMKLIRVVYLDLNASLKGSFLLDSDNELIPFRLVVANDSPYLTEKVHLKELKILHFCLVRYSNDIAELLDVSRLSIIIQETLQLDKPRFFESDFTNIMNQKLNSEGFLNGLVRLIREFRITYSSILQEYCGKKSTPGVFTPVYSFNSPKSLKINFVSLVHLKRKNKLDGLKTV